MDAGTATPTPRPSGLAPGQPLVRPGDAAEADRTALATRRLPTADPVQAPANDRGRAGGEGAAPGPLRPHRFTGTVTGPRSGSRSGAAGRLGGCLAGTGSRTGSTIIVRYGSLNFVNSNHLHRFRR